MNGLKIVTGNANPELARRITELVVEKFNTKYADFLDELCRDRRGRLREELPPLRLEDVWCEAEVSYFPDGEVYAHVEKTVRGQYVFVVQPTCPPRAEPLDPKKPGPQTVNDIVMELLLLVDALRRASAERVCAVTPYFGYARQDRKTEGRVPISARLLANLIERAGTSRVLAVELHASQIQGFFDIPLDHLRTDHLFARHIQTHHPEWLEDLVVVSPDIGGLFRARRVAERLHAPFATLAKRRFRGGDLEVLLVIGEVKGKKVLLVDDILSTGGTLIRAAKKLLEEGAREVYAACTHGIFAGNALQELESSPLSRIIVTDTIPQAAAKDHPMVEVVSVADDLAEAIIRIYLGLSISELLVRGR